MDRYRELETKQSRQIVERERQRVRQELSRKEERLKDVDKTEAKTGRTERPAHSMEERRKDIATALFAPKEMQDARLWSSLAPQRDIRRIAQEICKDIAQKEERTILTVQIVREGKTGLFEHNGEMICKLNEKDTQDRRVFACALGTMNHAFFQKLATEDLNKYPEHGSEQLASRTEPNVKKDFGDTNYKDGRNMIRSLKESKENRMDTRSHSNALLERAIVAEYTRILEQEENERKV